MIHIVTVIGARPQFIKAAAISNVIINKFSNKIKETIVHTGQHYDANMSEVFFSQMSIPPEKYNLKIGSATHGIQTAKIIIEFEKILIKEKPDAVLVYGDTNSTLSGAIAASKLEIPIIHIEAGLRSFTKKVPEEINRVVCDHLSTLLFTPSDQGLANLKNEGIAGRSLESGPISVDNPAVYRCGDVMYDISVFYQKIAKEQSNILVQYSIKETGFILATIHRQDNTNDIDKLLNILKSINSIVVKYNEKVVFPIHPRTRQILNSYFSNSDWVTTEFDKDFLIIDPVSYIDMVKLESASKLVITDSGGVQKEAYFYNKPCIILQNETPWVELLENGSSFIVGSDPKKIINAYNSIIKCYDDFKYPLLYGDGNSSEFIVDLIIRDIEEL